MPRQIELQTLLQSVGRSVDTAFAAERFGLGLYSDEIGFHVYGELNLTLKLTAATDTKDAQRLLRVLQEYTLLAEACAAEASAVLLEVQGERIHLLIPAPIVDANSVAELLKFCIAFTNAVYTRIAATAGKEFNGFKMAADHGRAILLSSGNQANGSLISLGPAANAPAKEMKRNGKAEHLRMRTSHYRTLAVPSTKDEWLDVAVRQPSATLAHLVSAELNQRFGARSMEYINNLPMEMSTVRFANRDFLASFTGGYVQQAIKVQGFPLRADLDGFSVQVEQAFANGDAAIAALVDRFNNILRYPAEFRAQIGMTIDLPWAGDCATVVVLPNGTDYQEAREYLPVKAAAEWHSLRTALDANRKRWLDHFATAEWAVGIAGGDDNEGSDGYVLIAPIAGRNRDFMVAAGWGVGRSLDAQESDGVGGEDTVIHKVDHAALDSVNRKPFKPLNSLFWITSGLTKDSLKSTGIEILAKTSPLYVPTIAQAVPKPKPWFFNARP